MPMQSKHQILNLIPPQSSLSFSLSLSLRLIDERINMANPDDISYVTAGYAPLLVRLVELLSGGTWKPLSDAMKLLPGPMLEFAQNLSFAEDLAEAVSRFY